MASAGCCGPPRPVPSLPPGRGERRYRPRLALARGRRARIWRWPGRRAGPYLHVPAPATPLL